MLTTNNPVLVNDNVDPNVTIFIIRDNMVVDHTQEIVYRDIRAGYSENETWLKQIVYYNSADEVIKVANEELESAPSTIPSSLL